MSKKVNFTKALLESATHNIAGARLVLRDAKAPGLQCRITHNGTITFSVYRRINGGKVERITLGKFPGMTIEQARISAAKVNACVAIGGNPAEVKRAHKGEMTFTELYTEYLEKHAKLRKRTWDDDACRYRLYLEKPLGNKRLSEVNRMHIASFTFLNNKAGETSKK